MNKTNIEWTDFTWNPITGCSAVSDGCKNCYAKAVHERFYKTPFSEVTFHKNRLTQPYKRRIVSKIFVGSMTDIFHDDVKDEWLDLIMEVVRDNPQHTFQMLTKRPKRMQEYLSNYYLKKYGRVTTYKNLWIGVTVENQEQADARIPLLLNTPSYVKFISVEPMVEQVNLTRWVHRTNGWSEQDEVYKCKYCGSIGWGKYFSVPTGGGDYECQCQECGNYVDEDDGLDTIGNIDWIIVGGETGNKSKARKMEYDWVKSIYDLCVDSGVPFFFKQWGVHGSDIKAEFEKVKDFPIKDGVK